MDGDATDGGPHLGAADLALVVGLVLRRRRRDLRMSQRQLAAECGVSQSTMARLERGAADVSLSAAQRALLAVGLHLAPVDLSGRVWLGDEAIEDDVSGVRDRAGRRHPAHLDATRGPMPSWGFSRAMAEGRLRDTVGTFRGYTFHRADLFERWLDALDALDG